MSGLVYYIIDLECTGLSLNEHEPVEISVIRCSDRQQITRYLKCETPETASWKALEITNLTIKKIQERGEKKETAVAAVHEFIEEDGLTPDARVFIGHIVAYDRRFSHRLWEKCGRQFPGNLFLDTKDLSVQWAKKIGLEKSSFSLDNCIKKFGLPTVSGNLHEARIDCRATYILWKKAIDAGVDYLPHIKRIPHEFASQNSNIEQIDDSEFLFD